MLVISIFENNSFYYMVNFYYWTYILWITIIIHTKGSSKDCIPDNILDESKLREVSKSSWNLSLYGHKSKNNKTSKWYIFYRASNCVMVHWVPEEEFASIIFLWMKKQGSLGWYSAPSLPNNKTTECMFGRSYGNRCTHNRPKLIERSTSDRLQVFTIDASINSEDLPSI